MGFDFDTDRGEQEDDVNESATEPAAAHASHPATHSEEEACLSLNHHHKSAHHSLPCIREALVMTIYARPVTLSCP